MGMKIKEDIDGLYCKFYKNCNGTYDMKHTLISNTTQLFISYQQTSNII